MCPASVRSTRHSPCPRQPLCVPVYVNCMALTDPASLFPQVTPRSFSTPHSPPVCSLLLLSRAHIRTTPGLSLSTPLSVQSSRILSPCAFLSSPLSPFLHFPFPFSRLVSSSFLLLSLLLSLPLPPSHRSPHSPRAPQMERAIEAAQAAHHTSPSNHGGRKGGRQRGGTGRARPSGDGEGAREAVLSLLQQEVQEEEAEQAERIESRVVARDASEEAESSGEDDDVVEVVTGDARQAGAEGHAGDARQAADAWQAGATGQACAAGALAAGKGRVTRGTGGGRSGEKGGAGARRVLRLREGEGGKGQVGGRANAGGDKSGRKPMILVVADEVDQLVRGRDTSVLTDLFLLPSLHAHSRCILIGQHIQLHSSHRLSAATPLPPQLNVRFLSPIPVLSLPPFPLCPPFPPSLPSLSALLSLPPSLPFLPSLLPYPPSYLLFAPFSSLHSAVTVLLMFVVPPTHSSPLTHPTILTSRLTASLLPPASSQGSDSTPNTPAVPSIRSQSNLRDSLPKAPGMHQLPWLPVRHTAMLTCSPDHTYPPVLSSSSCLCVPLSPFASPPLSPCFAHLPAAAPLCVCSTRAGCWRDASRCSSAWGSGGGRGTGERMHDVVLGAAARGAAEVEGGAWESVCTSFSFDPMALHSGVLLSPTRSYTSQKVAAASGDMRKALDITRMAVDVLEAEIQAQLREAHMGEVDVREADTREALPGAGSPADSTVGATGDGRSGKRAAEGEAVGQATGKRQRGGAVAEAVSLQVQVHHMAQALSRSFASSTVDCIRSLPLHQQMVLVACVQQHQQHRARHRFITRAKPPSTTNDFLLSQLYSMYAGLARSLHVPAVTLNEVTDMCAILHGQALLQVVGGGRNAARSQAKCKVMLKASAADVIFALQQAAMEASHEALAKGKVIGDVLDDFVPSLDIKVKYGGREVRNGDELTPSEAAEAPYVELAGRHENGDLYTLVMSDPDAPSPDNPVAAEWLHWLVVNIPGAATLPHSSAGDLVMGYKGPSPPMGVHRYVLSLFRQPHRLTTDAPAARKGFKTRQFAQEFGLGKPVTALFFRARKE
ncbi:unnamed protein product [Closterium sp. NIES-65]|nr:unnamed protein product [Closterium sp. NIES-65]